MKKIKLKKIPWGNFFFKLLIVMKLSIFVLCLSVFSAFATETYSQSTKLSLSLADVSINTVLKHIEDQSEFVSFIQKILIPK